LFHYPIVRELIAAHEARRVDGTDRLLTLINLEVWSRLYLDRLAPNDVADELKATLSV
jgi:asparagine synthase (glutamine-hydrolysing)